MESVIPSLFWLVVFLSNVISYVRLILFSKSLVGYPLTVIGGIIGKNAATSFDSPCRTKNIARELPRLNWYRSAPIQLLVGGFLPFRYFLVTIDILVSLWVSVISMFSYNWKYMPVNFSLYIVVQSQWNYIIYSQHYGVVTSTLCGVYLVSYMWWFYLWQLVLLWLSSISNLMLKTTDGGGVLYSLQGKLKNNIFIGYLLVEHTTPKQLCIARACNFHCFI